MLLPRPLTYDERSHDEHADKMRELIATDIAATLDTLHAQLTDLERHEKEAEHYAAAGEFEASLPTLAGVCAEELRQTAEGWRDDASRRRTVRLERIAKRKAAFGGAA